MIVRQVQQKLKELKFHDGDSAYLSRTPGSAGNRKTFTFLVGLKEALLELKVVLF